LAEVEFAVGPVDGFDEFLHAVTVPSTRSILRQPLGGIPGSCE
jgi:hypothetical protein